MTTTAATTQITISAQDLSIYAGDYYRADVSGDVTAQNQILQSVGILTSTWQQRDSASTEAAHSALMARGKESAERAAQLHAERIERARLEAIEAAIEYWDTTLVVAGQRLTLAGYSIGGLTTASTKAEWYQWSADVYAQRMAARGQDASTIRTVADRAASELVTR